MKLKKGKTIDRIIFWYAEDEFVYCNKKLFTLEKPVDPQMDQNLSSNMVNINLYHLGEWTLCTYKSKWNNGLRQ